MIPNRRQFFASSAKTVLAVSALSLRAEVQSPSLSIVRNGEPALLIRKAIEMLGGMSRFVKKGQSVLIKPNMSWDRFPEQAANTNPAVVAEVVKLCMDAGARYVRIVDRTCNQSQRCYKRSGIEEMASAAGAQVRHIVNSRFDDIAIPAGHQLKSWPIYKDVFNTDVFINIPIAKHHNVSGISLGMKNMMGLLGGDRGELHVDFATKIVDLNTVMRPALTIIDAYRILKRNGPSGGSLEDVENKETIIAGVDPVATDARAAMLFDLEPDKISYLVQAHERGLGQLTLEDQLIREFDFPA